MQFNEARRIRTRDIVMRILIIASSGDISRRQGPPDGYAFRKAGITVHVLLPRPIRGGEFVAEIDGIRFHKSFVFPFPRLFLISHIFFGVLKTIKLLYIYEFDVIHGHSAIGGIIGVLSKIITRKKIIVDFHYWEPSPGILEVYQGKWTDKDIRLKISNVLVKFVASNSNLIVATSNKLKEDLKRKGIN